MDIVATLPKQRFRDDDAIAGYAREPALAGGADGFFAAVVGFLRQVEPLGKVPVDVCMAGLASQIAQHTRGISVREGIYE